MGASSKAKAKSTAVAKRTGSILGVSRGKLKGAASSARGAAKAKTKSKVKAQSKTKGKSKTNQVLVAVPYQRDEVAEPSYYPDGMLDFIDDNNLTFLEGSILKRLVRLDYKDKTSDLKKLQMELGNYYGGEERTRSQVYQIASKWAEISTSHHLHGMRQLENKDWDYSEYEKTTINWYADRFIRAICSDNEVKWEMLANLKNTLNNLQRQLEQ